MKYTTSDRALQNWVVIEDTFKPEQQGKCEAIFCQGNGYLGVRSATEESYIGQTRNLFVNGTFNKFDATEVTELPNAADVTELEIMIDGELFCLVRGTYHSYQRQLNLKTGEVERSFFWTNEAGKEFYFNFKRYVSKDDLHLIMASVEIKALTASAKITIRSGINGQVSNSGAQHFHEGEKRFYDNHYLQLVQQTTQSKIDFIFDVCHEVHVGGKEIEFDEMYLDRRAISAVYNFELSKDTDVQLTKWSTVHTSRDVHGPLDRSLAERQLETLDNIRQMSRLSYQELFAKNVKKWDNYWEAQLIEIETDEAYDQLAVRFAQYHLAIMTPLHDTRLGIPAKGLSGEGYKGHSFWDTEIFVFPYWLYTNPNVAKKILLYRYQTIQGAYKKAKEYGHEGAMYPWESAWGDDGEVTPLWGSVDIITGKATKILSGLIEIHVTADIILAVWQYFKATEDKEFMDAAGYEMIYQTALFWTTRFEWNEALQRYEINDVVGSDEYKEHVNNNALTNHLAHHNMKIALICHEMLQQEYPEKLVELDQLFPIYATIAKIEAMMPLIYLPNPRPEDGLIPQDDTYLQLKEIDLQGYKKQQHVGSIFQDYNLATVNTFQVSKQADVVMLLYLLENRFDAETKWKNFQYYEAHTLHDSSLSLSTHSILGNDLGRTDLAYELFQKATQIDLGPNMSTSDKGIHAAAMGGIWQCSINGFGGVRIVGEKLRIQPRLPEKWHKLSYRMYWKKQLLHVTITKFNLTIEHLGQADIIIEINQQMVELAPKSSQTFVLDVK